MQTLFQWMNAALSQLEQLHGKANAMFVVTLQCFPAVDLRDRVGLAWPSRNFWKADSECNWCVINRGWAQGSWQASPLHADAEDDDEAPSENL